MGVTRDQLTADLSQLRIIGTMDLPAVAYVYATVNNAVAGTASGDGAAFHVSADGVPSRIADSWLRLRDHLQDILGHTAENVQSAARTILHIAAAYEETDEEVSATLHGVWATGAPPGVLEGEASPVTPAPNIVINQS